jgi:hypothetical protein
VSGPKNAKSKDCFFQKRSEEVVENKRDDKKCPKNEAKERAKTAKCPILGP